MSAPKRVFKQKRKISGGAKTFRKWTEWKLGEIVIGRYVEEHEDQYKKMCPVIEVIDAQTKDEKLNETLVGKQLVLNHCGQLRKAFDKIEFGTLVQVTYNGQSMIEKGPYADKEAHLVGVDEVEEGESEDSQDDEEVDL